MPHQRLRTAARDRQAVTGEKYTQALRAVTEAVTCPVHGPMTYRALVSRWECRSPDCQTAAVTDEELVPGGRRARTAAAETAMLADRSERR